jgi:type I restriction enzyme S subunit
MNSFLNWTSNIPLNWKVLPVKVLGKYSVSNVDKIPSEKEDPVLLCNYVDVYNNDFISSEIQFMAGTATLDEKRKFALRAGDIIITKDSESWDDIGIPALVVEDIPELICGYHLAIIRPDKSRILPEFLFRCIQSKDIRLQLELSSTGVTRFGLPKEAIGSMKVPVPNLKRQEEIAKFLTKEAFQIARLIDSKTKLIELLNEKRQALISEIITKGLNPNVSMKDSGVEWLGVIPEHWNVERTRWLFNERNERSETGEEEMLTVSHITGVTPRSEKNVNMFEAESTEGYKKCFKGDLVINTLWAWMGAMGTAPMEGIVSPAYHVYTPCTLLLPEFIDAIVRMPIFAAEVTRYSKGVWSSRLRLYPEGFYEVNFPVPPVIEQKEIVDYLKQETERIDQLTITTERSIELLIERRSALITAAITGQFEIPE